MKDLIERLERAMSGSRELDALIWAATAAVSDFGGPQFAPGWEPSMEPCEDGYVSLYVTNTETGKTLKHARRACPPLTTSLDAKLPGENIVESSRVGYVGGWMAMQASNGHFYYGNARTEVLARRIAALKSIMEAREE